MTTNNLEACKHLTKLVGTLGEATADNLRHLHFDSLKWALNDVVATHDIEGSGRRALGGCVHFKQAVLSGQPRDAIEAARAEAIRNVNALLVLVAAAEPTNEARNLGYA